MFIGKGDRWQNQVKSGSLITKGRRTQCPMGKEYYSMAHERAGPMTARINTSSTTVGDGSV